MECACSAIPQITDSVEKKLSDFYDIRSKCPVLKELVIPESILALHQKFSLEPLDEATHRSIPFTLFLKLEKGTRLLDFTSPLHNFCILDNRIISRLVPAYIQEFKETWVLKNSYLERYEQAKRYYSRWCELRVAQWLEEQKWSIINLEAYGHDVDICAAENDIISDIEVKYIGKSKELFQYEVEVMQGERSPYLRQDVYDPLDYLLLRVRDAAKQLSPSKNRKIACIILEYYHLSFSIPLSDKQSWIDWLDPYFLRPDGEIAPLLKREYQKNSNFLADMKNDIQNLDEIWIMSLDNNSRPILEHRILRSEF